MLKAAPAAPLPVAPPAVAPPPAAPAPAPAAAPARAAEAEAEAAKKRKIGETELLEESEFLAANPGGGVVKCDVPPWTRTST